MQNISTNPRPDTARTSKMAAFTRTVSRCCRLLSSRRLEIVRNGTRRIAEPGFIIPRSYSKVHTRTIITTKLNFPDLDVIRERLIGKDNSNIKRLVDESGCLWEAKVNEDHVYIEGNEYAVVKKAKDCVNEEVQAIRKAIKKEMHSEESKVQDIHTVTKEEQPTNDFHKWLQVQERVFIDHNAVICRKVGLELNRLGEKNIQKHLEGGITMYLKGNHIYIDGIDEDAVRRTAEQIAWEIQLIRETIDI